MINPRHNHRTGLLLAPVLLCFLMTGAGAVSVQAQPQSDAQKIYDEAVSRLYRKDYAKALEGAEAALKADPGFAPASLLKSEALVGLFKKKYGTENKLMSMEEPFRLLREAAESLDSYLKATPNAPDAPALLERLEALTLYGQLADRADAARTLFAPKEVTTKARLARDPLRSPPIERGTVTTMVVLSAEGRVKHVMLLDPVGEEEKMGEYLRAVGSLKFTPAIKDGRQVSQVLLIVSHVNTM